MINHSDTILSVHRTEKNLLRSECTLLEPDREVSAWILVDIPTMVIQDASWEIYRFPGRKSMITKLPKLKGIKAFLNAVQKLSSALSSGKNEPYANLITECVRGIIQVGCFFARELGFASDYAYIKRFEELYKESCMLYSNPSQWDWKERAYPRREDVIFKRVNSVTIKKAPSGECCIVSCLRDSHQQMDAFLKTNAQGIVLEAEGDFVLYPDILCTKTILCVKKLVGVRLAGISKGELGTLVGGPSGCDHLLSMLYKTAQTLDVTIQNSSFHQSSP